MPHSRRTPVRCMCAARCSTMRSSWALVSASVSASGATSRSWKVKNGTPSSPKSSNAASALRAASAMGSPAPNQGRASVSPPNMSPPGQQKRVPVADGEAQVLAPSACRARRGRRRTSGRRAAPRCPAPRSGCGRRKRSARSWLSPLARVERRIESSGTGGARACSASRSAGSGWITVSTGGAVHTASGSSPSTARRARRAAPKAGPDSPAA